MHDRWFEKRADAPRFRDLVRRMQAHRTAAGS
jgi:hypothetical protein